MSKPMQKPIDRTSLFQEMTLATQTLVTEFAEKLDREKHDSLVLRHELGQGLGQVIQGQSSYGEHAIEQLCQIPWCQRRLALQTAQLCPDLHPPGN